MTEAEKKKLRLWLHSLASYTPLPIKRQGCGNSGTPIAQPNIQLELLEFDLENLPEWAEDFAEFLLLTGQSHVDVATKCLLLKHSCKKKFLPKHVKQSCANFWG